MLPWPTGSEYAEELQSVLGGRISQAGSGAHQYSMVPLCQSPWHRQHQPPLCRVLLLSGWLLPLLGSP